MINLSTSLTITNTLCITHQLLVRVIWVWKVEIIFKTTSRVQNIGNGAQKNFCSILGVVYELRSILTINGVTSHDVGTYSCEARNSAGMYKKVTIRLGIGKYSRLEVQGDIIWFVCSWDASKQIVIDVTKIKVYYLCNNKRNNTTGVVNFAEPDNETLALENITWVQEDTTTFGIDVDSPTTAAANFTVSHVHQKGIALQHFLLALILSCLIQTIK